MILSELSRSKALFHMGYTQATPAVYRSAVEIAFNTISDEYVLLKIEQLIANCEVAWEAFVAPALIEDTREVVTGDNNLVTSDSKVPTRQSLSRTYSLSVSQLAFSLGVVNFRDESNYPLLDGAMTVNSIPGAKGDRGDRGRPGFSSILDEDDVYLLVSLYR